MKVLDLYCCQGGAGRGYADAGFEVTGVDLTFQPRYPFRFIQADATEFARDTGRGWFDFVHASPPCQHDSDTQRIQGNGHPDLIGPTRDALNATGLPWVIENVRGAVGKLNNPVMLCGTMFGLRTYRHRYFETGGGFTFTAPEHPEHKAPPGQNGATGSGRLVRAVHRELLRCRSCQAGPRGSLDEPGRHPGMHPSGVHPVHRNRVQEVE